jgi:hypothetical protein
VASKPIADGLLDELLAHPEWPDSQRTAVFEQLIAGCAPSVLEEAVRRRVAELAQPGGDVLLHLIEALDSSALYDALAQALLMKTNLPAERDWEALGLLHENGRLKRYPALRERWDELSEALGQADPLDDLVDQLDNDPDGLWLALEGFASIEPAVRAEIVEGLAARMVGPGVIEFLRMIGGGYEPQSRAAALGVLQGVPNDARVARESAPILRQSLVTAVRASGEALVVLEAEEQHAWTIVAFKCDMERGVVEVAGDRTQKALSNKPRARLRETFAPNLECPCFEGHIELALALLAGSVQLCGPDAPPAIPFWLDRTVGPQFQPRPLVVPGAHTDLLSESEGDVSEAARAVLAACPHWADRSPLTLELAEEIRVRERSGPDPIRDAAVYRYLFEHELAARIERYRSMLLWMASLWHSTGRDWLARRAILLARDLADGPRAVATHPFFEAIATLSLQMAPANLADGPAAAPAELDRP